MGLGSKLKKKWKKAKKKAKKLLKKAAPIAGAALGGMTGIPGGAQMGASLGSSLAGGGGGGGGFDPMSLAGGFVPGGGGGGGMPDWMSQIAGSFGGGEDGGMDWASLLGGGVQGYQQLFGGGGQGGQNPIQGIVPGMGGGGMPQGMNPAMLAMMAGGAMSNNKLPDQPNWMELAKMTADSERMAGTRAAFEGRNNFSNSQGSSEWIPEIVTDPMTGQKVTQWKNQTTLDPTLKATQDAQRGGDLMRLQAANNMLPGALGGMSQPLDYSQFGAGGTNRPGVGGAAATPPPGMMNGGAGVPQRQPGVAAGGVAPGMPAPQVSPAAPTGGGFGKVSSAVSGTRQPPSTGNKLPPIAPTSLAAPRPAPAPVAAPKPAPAAPPKISDAERIRRQLAGFTH